MCDDGKFFRYLPETDRESRFGIKRNLDWSVKDSTAISLLYKMYCEA